jgi:cell division protein FtsQ
MGLLLAASLAVFLGANVWKRALPAREIRLEGNVIVPSAEILKLAAISRGAKLYEIDLAAVRARIERNPYVRSVSVNRDGPEGITITVDERTPLAAIIGHAPLYIDGDGAVLPAYRSGPAFDLPVLTGALPQQDCVPGRRITAPSVREALDLLLLAREMGEDMAQEISEIMVREDGDLVVTTSDAGVPVVVGTGNLPMKLVKFEAFWREIAARRGPQDLQYVDLRFEDQVVVRWNDSAVRR